MKGLTNVSNPHDAALAALKAGADVIMMTWSFKDQAKAIERVIKAVKEGEFPIQELDEKVSRILAVKDFLKNKTPRLGDIESPKVVALSTKKLREIEAQILDFNIAVALKKSSDLTSQRAPTAIPNKGPVTSVCVFSPTNDFIRSFKRSLLKLNAVKTTAHTKPKMLVDYIKKHACTFGVYVVYGAKTATLLDRLPKSLAQKILVVNLSAPSLISNSDKFLNVVNLYFPHPDAGKKIADNIRALARRSSFGKFAHSELD